MQAPDPSNPGSGYLHSSASQQPMIPVAPMIPRTVFPHFPTRPIFSTEATQGSVHRTPVVTLPIPPAATSNSMNILTSSGSGVLTATNTQYSHNQPPQAHVSMKPMVAAAAMTQPMLNSVQGGTSALMPNMAVTTTVMQPSIGQPTGGISVSASVPHSNVGPPPIPMMIPPVAHHPSTTGISPFNQTSTQLPSFMSGNPSHMVAPVAPLQHSLGTSHRPIQAVQPQQVPVVQSGGSSFNTHGAHPGQQAQFQRLKVEDALSYLDQVKLQFGNHPQVYNDFLDIMKEFKSQSIDTPGVISRVSNLFKGHPELIVGFNTFLPPGYKIEVQANDTISVQQPGQPSMSLSQLTGAASNRDHHHLAPHHSTYKVKPVNLSVTASVGLSSSSSTFPSDIPRSGLTGLDNVVAAAAAPESMSNTPGQPVEFNHAISYVNKIKNRFQGQPDIYKNFLEILHKYQKEQKQIKDGSIAAPVNKPLTETEVYAQVAKLFQNQEDLLREFGQFLPDANGQGGLFGKSGLFGEARDHAAPTKPKQFNITGKRESHPSSSSKLSSNSSGAMRKFGPGVGGMPPSKKSRVSSSTSGGISNKEVTLAEAGKYGTLSEYAFFDKVRKVLRSQEVYDNFLRCLVLFNQEVISRTELIQMVQPFIGKFPELYRKFKDLLGYRDGASIVEAVSANTLSGNLPKAERPIRDELSMEIDYSSCKRYGHSYRALPRIFTPARSSGRTTLCREVLNDSWVSFPSWSEESTFVTSRKTQFEENIYRCEDERFELDMVIELNLATIKVLEAVQKKLQRMNSDDAAKFKLDNTLGGSSEVIHRKAIHRIYGDKAGDIIEGLKKNPVVAVPLVIRRLKSKDDEWKEAQRQFNKIWREQNEKYYLKSLDHQGINFKQNDVKSLRSKSLLNEIEAIYDAEQNVRKEAQTEPVDEAPTLAPTAEDAEKKPHLTYTYKNIAMVDDAMSLIIHHARRQSSIQKEDKRFVKQLMRQNMQKFFHRQTVPLSDDEDDDEESDEDEKEDSKPVSPNTTTTSSLGDKSRRSSTRVKAATSNTSNKDTEEKKSQIKTEPADSSEQDGDEMSNMDRYSLFYANSNWYLFLRLHQILCQRLNQIKVVCDRLVLENVRCKKDKSDSVAVALRLRLPSELEPEQYYSAFLELIKSLLDGNMESNQYEDQLREIFGIHAYITFTLDKVIQNIVKQLQYIATDELCRDVTDSWIKEASNHAAGGDLSTRDTRSVAESAYKKRMESMLNDDNCFEILMFKKESLLAFTLLDTESDGSVDSAIGQVERWNDYIDKYVPGELDPNLSEEVKEHLKAKPIFLKRNTSSWKKCNQAILDNANAITTAISTAEETKESPNNIGKEEADKTSSPTPTAEKTGEGGATVTTESAEPISADKSTVDNGSEKMETDDGETRLPSSLDVVEGEQCRFNLGSFKMVKVVKSEDYLYRKEAFTRAAKTHKKVSQTMYKQWEKFCKKWRDANTVPTESCKIKGWLNGDHLEDCRPCQTTCRRDNDVDKAPYRVYNRYTVKYEKVTAAVASSIDDGSLTALSTASDDAMDTV